MILPHRCPLRRVSLVSFVLAVILAPIVSADEQSSSAPSCPNSCSANGECIEGVCLCAASFSGPDCSIPVAEQKFTFPSLEDAVHASRAEVGSGPALKVCLVTTEFVGPVSNGGIGTAFTSMAISLRDAGHEVTVLFTMGPVSQHGPFQDWVQHYAKEGIELVGLWRPNLRYIPRHMLESYEVLRFLRDRANFHVVHFHDYFGAGYYPMLAKQQGDPLLAMSRFVLGLHGPNLWAKGVGNQEAINQIGDLEMDYMERKSVEMADYVVSPSRYLLAWMAKEGWPVNESTAFVQPNILPIADRRAEEEAADAQRPKQAVRELVFFGRLETRKGVILFCEAIEQLLRPSMTPLIGDAVRQLQRVTFLGRSAMVNGRMGVEYVQERAQRWGINWKIISRLGPVEAKQYLAEPGAGRLAVMPSRIENSPYTVYECAELGIPFVAAEVGGVADLVHPQDHKEALFQPNLDALVSRLISALMDGVTPVRPRYNARHNERVWMDWHRMVGTPQAAGAGEGAGEGDGRGKRRGKGSRCEAPPTADQMRLYKQQKQLAVENYHLRQFNKGSHSTNAWSDERLVALPLGSCGEGCHRRGACIQLRCAHDEAARERYCPGQHPPWYSRPAWFDPKRHSLRPSPVCSCFFGYEGERCEETSDVYCLNGCSARGQCVQGFCKCDEGAFGADCSLEMGPEGRAVRWDMEGRTHQDRSPLIYVYDLPPALSTHYYAFLAAKRKPFQKQWTHPALEGPSGGDFFVGPVQLFMHEALLASPHRTTDPARADFFFVPAWERAADNSLLARDYLVRVRDYIAAEYPFWNRTGGADHMWVFPHDQGACYKHNQYEVMPELRRSILVSHFGLTTDFKASGRTPYRVKGPCHRVGQDIVVPPPLNVPIHQSPYVRAGEAGAAARGRRAGPLLYFAGSLGIQHYNQGTVDGGVPLYSHGVRQAVFQLTQDRHLPQFAIHQGSDHSYLAMLANATFCLAPSGLGFGVRIVHAVVHGCIPVVIQDDVLQPFEGDLLPYAAFSLRVPEAHIPQLPEILGNVSEAAVAGMQEQLACVWRMFLWSSVYGAAAGEDGGTDALAALLALLRRRLRPRLPAPATGVERVCGALVEEVRELQLAVEGLCARYCLVGGRPCMNEADRKKAAWEAGPRSCGQVRAPGRYLQPAWQPWPPGGAAAFTRNLHFARANLTRPYAVPDPTRR